jgi:hypothetical protein
VGPRVPSSALIAGCQRKARRHSTSHCAPNRPRPRLLPSHAAENPDDLHHGRTVRLRRSRRCRAPQSVIRLKTMTSTRSKVATFIFDNSLLLLAGTAAAVLWANLDVSSYDRLAHPLHFWVNDVGMVFFFALAAKEMFEATLPEGPPASPRRAMGPLGRRFVLRSGRSRRQRSHARARDREPVSVERLQRRAVGLPCRSSTALGSLAAISTQ